MEFIALALGALLQFCMKLCGNYLLAVILFTFMTKLILLPITVWTHFNSIRLVRMTPMINRLKINFYGDRDAINEKTLALYKQEHYHPLLSIIPLILQLILLMGVIEVVKMPETAGIAVSDMQCFGIDFTAVASETGGWYYLAPLLSALSSVFMCAAQNRSQVLQSTQSSFNKYGMLIISSVLSLYLGFFVCTGVVFYWILSNLFSVIQLYLINFIIDPNRYIDKELLKKTQLELKEIASSDRHLTKDQKKRQRKDFKRFFSIANKHLVLYSEQSGFYKYYRRMIEWLVQHSNITIHYVTSDPDDIVFRIAEEPLYKGRIQPYFIGDRKLITLFMKMDAGVVLMTTPDLDNYHIKRSYVDKNVHYIYMVHGLASFNYTLRRKASNAYDAIFCAGESQRDEIRALEKLYGLAERPVIYAGTGLVEDMEDAYNEYRATHPDTDGPRKVLIAPSYQPGNIIESCLDPLVDAITALGCKVIIRPHPQFVRRKLAKWNEIEEQYSGNELVETEKDFSSNETVYSADLLITDWSAIGYEFSLSTLKPSVYVNTARKIINSDYKEIDVEPIDTYYRNNLGISVDPGSREDFIHSLGDFFENYDKYREKIIKVRSETLPNYMHSSEAGGKYILSRLIKKK